jgi:hypothetical protein
VADRVAHVRDVYRAGTGRRDVNASRVHRELAQHTEAGRRAAMWIVERSLADFEWEAWFWAAEHGRQGVATAREALAGPEPWKARVQLERTRADGSWAVAGASGRSDR